MYQELTLVGNLGKNPELRHTQSGIPVTSFSVAVNKRWRDRQSGEQREKTTWFRVTCWRGLAETCNEFLSKGRLVLVTGEMRPPEPYQSKSGEWRASLNVTAQTVQFLGGGEGNRDKGSVREVPVGDGARDEEIPF